MNDNVSLTKKDPICQKSWGDHLKWNRKLTELKIERHRETLKCKMTIKKWLLVWLTWNYKGKTNLEYQTNQETWIEVKKCFESWLLVETKAQRYNQRLPIVL